MSVEFTKEEKALQEEAIAYVEAHSDALVEKFVTSKKPLQLDLVSIFMAGSPGAGKTEFVRRYLPGSIDKLNKEFMKRMIDDGVDLSAASTLFIRIDVDEIRIFLPQYQKTDAMSGRHGNAHVIQKAATKGLDIIRSYCFANHISFLHDGTFGNYRTMRSLIKKSLHAERAVQIFYLYLDPLVAWKYTQAREYEEGRNILKEKFIEQFFDARENIDKIKSEFGDAVTVHFVLRKAGDGIVQFDPETTRYNIEGIDTILKNLYSQGLVREYTRGDLQHLILDV